eukprot:tig00000133_g7690.t1
MAAGAVVSGGCGEQAGPRGLRQQLIAASASGVGVPAGRGALRLMEVAALVLAAALKAGNERLARLLHRHRVDSPLLAAPTAHPPASPSSPSSACPARPLVPRGPDGAGGDRSRAASFTSLFRAHAAGA